MRGKECILISPAICKIIKNMVGGQTIFYFLLLYELILHETVHVYQHTHTCINCKDIQTYFRFCFYSDTRGKFVSYCFYDGMYFFFYHSYNCCWIFHYLIRLFSKYFPWSSFLKISSSGNRFVKYTLCVQHYYNGLARGSFNKIFNLLGERDWRFKKLCPS
jgi:hypothetical protein